MSSNITVRLIGMLLFASAGLLLGFYLAPQLYCGTDFHDHPGLGDVSVPPECLEELEQRAKLRTELNR